jgi:hypothetical protein
VAAPILSTLPLGDDLDAVLAQLPPRAGVGQLLGEGGRSLVIGRAAHLRRWAATHLGAEPPAHAARRRGPRPPTNLRPVTAAIAYAETTSGFHQRLVFERLMSAHVPLSARRDLRPPAFLRLDIGERFPRILIRPAGDEGALFGPFRDRRAAERASKALHKLFPLRPCDYTFEPDPALPMGLGCLYAQVRSCSAPCLARIAEEEYRHLARRAAGFLACAEGRPEDAEAWMPRWVGGCGRSLVVDEGSGGLELYPVSGLRVADEGRVSAPAEALDEAAARVCWPEGQDRAGAEDDGPWLTSWLYTPRRRGLFLRLPEGEAAAGLASQIRAGLAVVGSPQG